MMAMDIHKTRFEAVEICGVPALFTVERVRRSELPNGIYAYDMQTSEEDWSQQRSSLSDVSDGLAR